MGLTAPASITGCSVADYWGCEAIGARMGVKGKTIRAWHRTQSFLMYKRTRWKLKPCWYTNDVLIQTWELAKCRQDREADAERRAMLPSRKRP